MNIRDSKRLPLLQRGINEKIRVTVVSSWDPKLSSPDMGLLVQVESVILRAAKSRREDVPSYSPVSGFRVSKVLAL